MPKIEFDSGFKKKGWTEYNKLTLESGEKARICVIESPTFEYVHTLRKVITQNGKPVMKTESFPQKGGGTREREVPDTDYVGKFICLGDTSDGGALDLKGVDPENCPACKYSLETPAIDGPKRRFAVHVIKYQVKKGQFTVQSPFQAELLAWEFSDTRFNTLVDIREEHGSLPGIDLCLGPCQNKTFQKFDILPGGKCEWSQDDSRKAIIGEILKQRYADLTPLIGRTVTPAELRAQCVDVTQTWDFAFGTQGELPSEVDNAVESALQQESSEPENIVIDFGDDTPTVKSSKSEEDISLEELLGMDLSK